MHEVCKEIRDPNFWRGVKPEEMFGKYLRFWDERVSRAFSPERRVAVVNLRDPLFGPDASSS